MSYNTSNGAVNQLFVFRPGKRILTFVALIALGGSLCLSLVSRATGIDYFSVTLSAQTKAVAANQAVRFITASGVDSPTDTIVLSYPAAFNLSALVSPTDFDFAVDDDDQCDGPFTDKTLASVPSSGIWGVAVGSTTITLTPPTDAVAGEIDPARCVQIQIGTNANVGGTGVDQIVNPPTAGSYAVTVAGGFGDFGGTPVAVTDNEAVGVTATVGSPGSGAPPPPGDTTPPLIINLQITGITASSATVSWGTDEPASSTVIWGTTTAYADGLFSDSSLVYSHEYPLTGLTDGTVYYVKVTAQDASGNVATATTSFTTIDNTAPIISDLQVISITETTARVVWTTNEPATSNLSYGTTTAYTSGSFSDATLTTDHVVDLTGLTPGALYHFLVSSADASGNNAVSSDQTFTTLINLPPANAQLTVTPGIDSNALSWTLPSESDLAGVVLVYRTDRYPTGPFDGTVLVNGMATSFDHTGLTAGVTYYYGLFVYDTSGQYSSGTLGQGTPTGPISPSGCDICHRVSYDLYIVNPDGTERHMGSNYVLVTDEGGGRFLVAYEDKGVDFDYNDLKVEMDTHDCSTLTLTEIGSLASWHHEVRLKIFLDGSELTDMQVWADDHAVTSPVSLNALASLNGSCPAPPVVVPVCGNAVCESGETADSCPVDCAVAPPPPVVPPVVPPTPPVTPPVTPPGGQTTPPNEVIPPVIPPTQVIPPTEVTPPATPPSVTPVTPLFPPAFVAPVGSVAEAASAAAQSIGETVQSLNRSLDAVRALPGVQPVTSAIAAASIFAAVAQAAVLTTLFDIIPFLQYLFTSPFLLFWRRKRKTFGVVYDAYTKLPVDLAIVRLYRLPDDKLISTVVTDRQGRYVFLTQPGRYRIRVVKPRTHFPSVLLAKVKDDGEFLDVYHGEVIAVEQRDSIIAVNIPVDPVTAAAIPTRRRLQVKRFLRRLQAVAAVSGIVLSAFVFLVRPSVVTAVLCVGQVLIYALFRRLARTPKPSGWGIVYDAKTKRPIKDAIVRVFDPMYNKLLDSKITDAGGRYFFLLGPAKFIASFEKPSYEKKELRPVDFTSNKGPKELKVKIALNKKDV